MSKTEKNLWKAFTGEEVAVVKDTQGKTPADTILTLCKQTKLEVVPNTKN